MLDELGEANVYQKRDRKRRDEVNRIYYRPMRWQLRHGAKKSQKLVGPPKQAWTSMDCDVT